MVKHSVIVELRQKRNIEVCNGNAFRKELEALDKRKDDLIKLITKSETRTMEYDKIILAILAVEE